MTGESDHMKKESVENCIRRAEEEEMEKLKSGKIAAHHGAHSAHELPSPIIMSGTSISEGEGKMVAIVVGDCSAIGIIRKTLEAEVEGTPL